MGNHENLISRLRDLTSSSRPISPITRITMMHVHGRLLIGDNLISFSRWELIENLFLSFTSPHPSSPLQLKLNRVQHRVESSHTKHTMLERLHTTARKVLHPPHLNIGLAWEYTTQENHIRCTYNTQKNRQPWSSLPTAESLRCEHVQLILTCSLSSSKFHIK